MSPFSLAFAPSFLAAGLSLEDVVASDRLAELSPADRNISAQVLPSGGRNWTIEFEGANLVHVDENVLSDPEELAAVLSVLVDSKNVGKKGFGGEGVGPTYLGGLIW